MNEYVFKQVKENYPNINVVNIQNDKDFEEVKKELIDILGE